MKLRRCARCAEVQPDERFCPRADRAGQWDSLCRTCRAAYGKEHYEANKQRYIDLAAQRKKTLALERMEYLLTYFDEHPCKDCGETDPVVLEFDHLRDESFDIGSRLSHQAWANVLREIEKCEVVCANCHRRRTAGRRGTLRWVLAASRQAGLGDEAGDQNRTGA